MVWEDEGVFRSIDSFSFFADLLANTKYLQGGLAIRVHALESELRLHGIFVRSVEHLPDHDQVPVDANSHLKWQVEKSERLVRGTAGQRWVNERPARQP